METKRQQVKVWVLTEEHNLYDQQGEYFVEVFFEKPTRIELEKATNEVQTTDHLLNGGGRIQFEEHWYNLRERETK